MSMLSMTSTSFPHLLIILPVGVCSRKDMGALSNLPTIFSCKMDDALNADSVSANCVTPPSTPEEVSVIAE